jgi:hypothetical protein
MKCELFCTLKNESNDSARAPETRKWAETQSPASDTSKQYLTGPEINFNFSPQLCSLFW